MKLNTVCILIIIIAVIKCDNLVLYPNIRNIEKINPIIKNKVILLRNPIKRAVSAYNHLIRDNREKLSFLDLCSI